MWMVTLLLTSKTKNREWWKWNKSENWNSRKLKEEKKRKRNIERYFISSSFPCWNDDDDADDDENDGDDNSMSFIYYIHAYCNRRRFRQLPGIPFVDRCWCVDCGGANTVHVWWWRFTHRYDLLFFRCRFCLPICGNSSTSVQIVKYKKKSERERASLSLSLSIESHKTVYINSWNNNNNNSKSIWRQNPKLKKNIAKIEYIFRSIVEKKLFFFCNILTYK